MVAFLAVSDILQIAPSVPLHFAELETWKKEVKRHVESDKP